MTPTAPTAGWRHGPVVVVANVVVACRPWQGRNLRWLTGHGAALYGARGSVRLPLPSYRHALFYRAYG